MPTSAKTSPDTLHGVEVPGEVRRFKLPELLAYAQGGKDELLIFGAEVHRRASARLAKDKRAKHFE